MRVDNDLKHLHPAFRAKLEIVLKEVAQKTGHPWVVVEGFRSQERQDWLYAQGRSRPGDIVTWIRSPRWHGVGLAADVAPTMGGQVWYACPRTYWTYLRDIYRKHGLGNPAWSKGDLGHVQSLNKEFQATARAWVARGFQD